MSIKNDINKILLKKFPHLEISVVKYSEVQTDNESKRIDSEYFKQIYLRVVHLIKKRDYIQLKDIDITIKHPAEIERNYIENGIWFVRAQNIKSLSLDINNKVFISQEDADKLSKNIINKKDILMIRTGNCGDCVIYLEKENAIASSHIFIIRNKFFNQYFLSVFFSCKYGKLQIERGKYGSLQPEVATSYLRNIYIPMFSKEFQLEIETMVKDSHKALENSKKLYKEAEKILYEALGLDAENPLESILSFREKNKVIHNHLKRYKRLNISIRTYKESYLKTGRLDAEYYQVKYDLIENIIKDYSKGYCKLSDIGFFTNGSFIPESFYTEQAKRAYIRIKELSLDSPINMKDCIYINDKFKNSNETIVKENDFVIATIGNTIGKINLITKELEGSFISNNTSRFRLTDKNVNPIFLELLLRNSIVQEQIQREFTQTAQPKISNNSLENIIIPKIDYIIQKKIEYRIKKSLELRDKSKELLENAKVKIENAIIDS